MRSLLLFIFKEEEVEVKKDVEDNLQISKEATPSEAITSFETIIPFKEITPSETIKLMKELISIPSPLFS